jgi:hypothetical protein
MNDFTWRFHSPIFIKVIYGTMKAKVEKAKFKEKFCLILDSVNRSCKYKKNKNKEVKET